MTVAELFVLQYLNVVYSGLIAMVFALVRIVHVT